MDDKERRIRTEAFRVTRDAGSDALTVSGYAAVYNVDSENLGGFVERIAPGAFADVMDNDVRAFFNHDESLILGRTAAGTLELSDDERGLEYRITLPATSYAQDLAESMRRGDVDQSSFSFTVARGGAEWRIPEDDDEPATRTVTRVARLWDVAPVSIPAYPDTSAAVRSWVKCDQALRELAVERGLSRGHWRTDPRHQRARLRLMLIGNGRAA